ncbi:MAG: hypothetical protein ABJB10_23225, partial [Mesorhizobium sp.]
LRGSTLPADKERNQADGNDNGEYEQGRHHPPQGKFKAPPPLRQATKPGRGLGPRPGSVD